MHAAAARESTPACGNCCAGYTCDGINGTCAPPACAPSLSCLPDYYCAARECVPKQDSGTACVTPDQCASGNCSSGTCFGASVLGAPCGDGTDCASGACVDAVCCDSACDGQCEACDVAGRVGVCSPVEGLPHGARTACDGGGTTCAGQCAGSENTAACSYPRVVGECQTICSASSPCAAGFYCQGALCHPGGAVCIGAGESQSTTDGGTSPCARFICQLASGTCLTQCSTIRDCSAPNVCDPESGRCVAPPASSGEVVSGCQCRVPRARSRDGWRAGACLAIAAAGAASRRRRRRS